MARAPDCIASHACREAALFLPSQCKWAITLMAASSIETSVSTLISRVAPRCALLTH